MSLRQSALIGLALLAGTQAAVAQTTSSSSSTSQSQSQPSAKPPAKTQKPATADALPVSLDRIREGVMRDSRITLPDFGVPTFRISVEQQTIKIPGQFDKTNAVGDYVRGQYFSNAHQEFLDMSSPSGRPVVTPGGIPVLGLVSALKRGFRDREAARIRAQIRDELSQIDPSLARPASTGSSSSPPEF
jgi:hypothetical protein